ncbi:MAG: hypothetical protein E6K94_00495 [Thaumarchaeota archaeon]|nr:MAG: hypothetical protein E6K94_00495 [Nitrososphaerota archaeon]
MKTTRYTPVKCAECECDPKTCETVTKYDCKDCTKKACCCLAIHMEKKEYSITKFLYHTRNLFMTALAIEILCITAAEIGQNSVLAILSYNIQGATLGYLVGYAAAGFTTFMTILGRYQLNVKTDSCCSVLEQQSSNGFLGNFFGTFKNFGVGVSRFSHMRSQRNLKQIIKTSLVILITAESVCILTAESVDLIFYNQSILLSIPLALIAGSFTVVIPEAYKKIKSS